VSVSLNNVARVLVGLGQGEQARQLYTESLEIARRLAAAEPERADYQRDLETALARFSSLGPG
jgi:hypothetical protein